MNTDTSLHCSNSGDHTDQNVFYVTQTIANLTCVRESWPTITVSMMMSSEAASLCGRFYCMATEIGTEERFGVLSTEHGKVSCCVLHGLYRMGCT